MINLLDEIREHFATNQQGMRPIKSLNPEWQAFTLRQGIEFGVAIEFNQEIEVNEESTSAIISTQSFIINGNQRKFLLLSCFDEEYRNEFAELCCHFVEPGPEGNNRKNLLNNTRDWWDHWTNMLGDSKTKRHSYDVIAELLALDLLYSQDKSIIWTAAQAGSHDIESDSISFEVKSTVKKSETSVTISSQHQLLSEKPLYLLFCRMEKSSLGLSINDLKTRLVSHGYDETLLES